MDDRREKPGTAIATKQIQNRPETSESIQKLNSEIFRVDFQKLATMARSHRPLPPHCYGPEEYSHGLRGARNATF